MANSTGKIFPNQSACYRIKIKEEIHENWSDWLNGMNISIEPNDQETLNTILVGIVPDQAALRGILCKLWDLNLTILSVSQLGMKDRSKGKENDQRHPVIR